MSTCPSQASRLLNALLTMPTKQMWPYVNTFVKYLRSTLDDSVPLHIRGKIFRFLFIYITKLHCKWLMNASCFFICRAL